jgi:hypothetical protein
MRVDDVRAALVLSVRRDGEVLDGHHRGEPIDVLRVADADPPAAVRAGPAARDDIAAGIDAEVRGAGGGQPLRGAVDGPALDQAGRVQPAGGPRREEAARGRSRARQRVRTSSTSGGTRRWSARRGRGG